MIETGEFLSRTYVDADRLRAWIEYGWLLPSRDASGSGFSEIDVARARLIRDLQDDMGVNDEAISIILDLLDQMHGLRRALRDMLANANAPRGGTRAPFSADNTRS